MRKLWCLFLAVLLIFSVTACSAKAPEETAGETIIEEQGEAVAAELTQSGEAGGEYEEIEDEVVSPEMPRAPYMVEDLTAEPLDPYAEGYVYTGIYDIIRIDAGDKSASETEMQQLRDRGYDAYMSFGEGGTGLMRIAERDRAFTYDIGSGEAYVDGIKVSLTFQENGLLAATDTGGTMYLLKRPEE